MKNLIAKIKALRMKVAIWLCRHSRLHQNKVIFWSDDLKNYGCNPKYLTEYLAKQTEKKLDLVWVFNESAKTPIRLPDGVRTVRYFSLKYLYELHTAKFIVCNARMSPALYFHKRRGQVYIQTWHSSMRLKMIEGDANLPESYVEIAKADSANIDLLISGSAYSTQIFRRAFWYDGRILESGTPRCDILLCPDAERQERTREALGIPKNVKTILYAPTFRKGYAKNDLGLDYEALRNAAAERL